MDTLAILNQKGGSAKTTTAVNLAAALAEKKKKVLLIDIDSQGSSTLWLGFRNTEKGLFSVFTENTCLSSVICETFITGLSVVPSSQWLFTVERVLASEVGAETILKKKLAAFEQSFDYILIDCPPTLGIMSLNALTAANKVIVPIETHIMAVQGLAQLLNTIQTVKDRLNPSLEIDGILPCRVNKRTRLSQDIVADLRERFKGQIYQTMIRENVKLAEAPSFGKPITIYDSKSTGAEDYRSLASEVIKRSKNK